MIIKLIVSFVLLAAGLAIAYMAFKEIFKDSTKDELVGYAKVTAKAAVLLVVVGLILFGVVLIF